MKAERHFPSICVLYPNVQQFSNFMTISDFHFPAPIDSQIHRVIWIRNALAHYPFFFLVELYFINLLLKRQAGYVCFCAWKCHAKPHLSFSVVDSIPVSSLSLSPTECLVVPGMLGFQQINAITIIKIWTLIFQPHFCLHCKKKTYSALLFALPFLILNRILSLSPKERVICNPQLMKQIIFSMLKHHAKVVQVH